MLDDSGPFAGPATVPNPGEDDFARAAADAFERGDDRLALQQVAAALSFAPLRPDLLHLLEQTLARQTEPADAYAPLLRSHAFFGFHAADAWAKARAGQLGKAVETLLQVACFRPDVPYLRWAERWIQDRGTRGIGAVEILPHLRQFVSRAMHTEPARVVENVESAIRIAHALRRDRANAAAGFALVESALLRHLGFSAQAVEVCEAHTEKATFELWIELAAGCRATDRVDRAIVAYEAAARERPRDLAVWIDLGDTNLDAGRLAEAVRAYDTALGVSAASAHEAALAAQAKAAAAYARVLASGGSADARAALELLAETSEPARELLHDLASYGTWLPQLRGHLAGLLRTLAADLETAPPSGARVRIELDAEPSPGVVWAFREVAAASGTGAGLVFVAGGREIAGALGPVTIADGTVMKLADEPFDADAWIAGAPSLPLEEAYRLLESGVPPPSSDPAAALLRLRIALLAQIARAAPKDEDAWQRILSEAASPDPWRVAAATVVLGAIARSASSRSAAASSIVANLVTSTNDEAVGHVASSLAITLPGFGYVFRRAALRRKRSSS